MRVAGQGSGGPCFEIGLTMAGAVSAGAYTAGVLDFLVEALDKWHAAKACGRDDVPDHRINLRVMSGASAGALSAVILAANARVPFPAVHYDNRAALGPQNPLYDAWVNRIDMSELLKIDDIVNGDVPLSLLNTGIIDRIGKEVVRQTTDGLKRDYISETLRTIVTLTNITGVPYVLPAQAVSQNRQVIVAHDDVMQFVMTNAGSGEGKPPNDTAGYGREYVVDLANCGSTINLVRNAAIASAAFPLGLRPRTLNRDRSDYNGRPLLLPRASAGEQDDVIRLVPSWPPEPKSYRFVNFDGGCIDNSPFEWARTALSGGLDQHNARAGNEASKAVIIIDPFPQVDYSTPVSTEAAVPLHMAALTLLGVYKDQARFRSDELALANDSSVYSRFLIAPVRPEPGVDGAPDSKSANGPWIASGALGGFSGFFHSSYREHDFQLGRRNCQQFLRANFTLSKDNPLFASWRNAPWAERYKVPIEGGSYELPVIPLMDELLASEEKLPSWPYVKFQPEALRGAISSRSNAIFAAWMKNQSWWSSFAHLAWMVWGRGKVTDEAISAVSRGLQAQRLLPDAA